MLFLGQWLTEEAFIFSKLEKPRVQCRTRARGMDRKIWKMFCSINVWYIYLLCLLPDIVKWQTLKILSQALTEQH